MNGFRVVGEGTGTADVEEGVRVSTRWPRSPTTASGDREMLAIELRPGNAGSNTASDHIEVTRAALAQLPGGKSRPGKGVLIRTDSAGGTHDYVNWLTRQRVSYSVGFTLSHETPDLYRLIPEDFWERALDTAGEPREGAAIAEFTGTLDLHGWPTGTRGLVRRERPHPGAQLRFGDVDGYRLTAFATNTRHGQLQCLQLRHRRRVRCEDQIRQAEGTGLPNLPLHGFDRNRIRCQIVALAGDPIAWAGLLAHPQHKARRWEPKRLRYRLFTIPATIARRDRRVILHLSNRARWADTALTGTITPRRLPTPSG